MLKIHGLAFLLLPFATAGAQSQASVTESRVVTEKNGGKPDTVLMRTISSGRRTRVDVTGPGTLLEPWRSMGTTEIDIASDSAETDTYVDSANKSYWSTNMRSLLANVQKTTGLDVKTAAAADVFTLDSIGSGDVVAGYNTVHFRGHSTIRMTMSVLGDATSWTDVQTADYYVAPGLHLDSLEKAAKRGPELESGMLPSGMKQLMAQRAPTMKRMTKIGSTVKTVTQSKVTVGDGVRNQRQTTELLSHRMISVPDSLFVVPAGYTKTFPGFTPARESAKP